MIRSEFNFISIGTEKSGSNGYMSVSEVRSGFRIISPIEHSNDVIDENNEDNLYVTSSIPIEGICMLRFQLISAVTIKNITDKDVCIFGCGAIGIGAYMECIRQRAKSVMLITRRNEAVTHYNNCINIEGYDGIKNSDVYIDCTGDEKYIYSIIEMGSKGSTFYELGTPRKSPQIDLLKIHRKNMSVIGCHEINGISRENRREQCRKLNDYYIENHKYIAEMCKRFVRMHIGNEKVITDIYEHRFIEPFNVLIRRK